MNLSVRIISRLSPVLLVLMAVWATLFYFIIIDEINDETDDSLEDYSENIIRRALAGEQLPAADNGTNNSYHIREVTPQYATQNEGIKYIDETVYLEAKHETEPARTLKTIFIDGNDRCYELTVSIPTIEKEDLRLDILLWIVFLYLVLLIAVIVINWLALHRNFRPLRILLKWVENFNVDKTPVPLFNPTTVTEFRKLNEAIIRSAVRSTQSYEQQKQFTAYASHELQTPLAVCRNRLEMLSDDSLLTEDQLGEIIKVKQSLDQLVKLNKTLLLLVKIENSQFPDHTTIDLSKTIAKLTSDYAEVYASRDITLSLREEARPTLCMNSELATTLFGNLLKNAYLHNRTGGTINIHITASHLVIANTGTHTPLDSTVIFDRFCRGSNSEGSTGLGLALCKSVCSLCGMNISYSFSGEQHVFTLQFHT